MLKTILLSPLLALAPLALSAQSNVGSGAVEGLTFDLRIDRPSTGETITRTFTFGNATGGESFQDAFINTDAGDVVTFENVSATASQTAPCDVTGIDLTYELVLFFNGAETPVAFGLADFNLPLDSDGFCPVASTPSNLPCAAGAEVFNPGVTPTTRTFTPALFDFIGASVAALGSPFNEQTEFRYVLTIEPITNNSACSTGKIVQRSQVRFDPNASLPVELMSFSAQRHGGRDVINWAAAAEIDFYGYSIERAVGNGAFEEVAFVEALGTEDGMREYEEFVYASAGTEALGNAATYYRLRGIDYDGTESYSSVVVVGGNRIASVADEILLGNYLPAGAGGRIVDLPVGSTTVEIFDLTGRVVSTASASIGATVGQDLPAGQYVIRASAAGEARTQRFVVH